MPHPDIERILSTNAKWAKDVHRAQPEFFAECAKGQAPKLLWIGCADSRVPESVVTGAKPGDIFVHRNIANQFHPDDESAVSVLTYAVLHLKVQHVAIVGHEGCGGAAACFNAACDPKFNPNRAVVVDPGLPADAALNVWLSPLTKLASKLELSSTPVSEAVPILVEENVKLQLANLAENSIITDSWAAGKDVWIHGWVYDIATGRLRDLGITQGPKY